MPSKRSAAASEQLTQIRQLAETQQQDLGQSAKRWPSWRSVWRTRGAVGEPAGRRAPGSDAAHGRTCAANKHSLAIERGQLESESAEQARRVESLQAKKERLEARKVALETEWEQARVRSLQVDDALRTARQKLGDLREERGRLEVERARNDSERSHLRETSMAELNVQPEDLIAEFPVLLSGEGLAAAETQLSRDAVRGSRPWVR